MFFKLFRIGQYRPRDIGQCGPKEALGVRSERGYRKGTLFLRWYSLEECLEMNKGIVLVLGILTSLLTCVIYVILRDPIIAILVQSISWSIVIVEKLGKLIKDAGMNANIEYYEETTENRKIRGIKVVIEWNEANSRRSRRVFYGWITPQTCIF